MMRLAIAAAVLAIVQLIAAASAPQRVLFVGNSLTAANNLPQMVEAVARQHGDLIASEMVAFPDYSLEDHWRRGDAVRAIARGGWSAVVLQQGPSALPESRALLRAYVRRFDQEARRAGAKIALYMVWPSAARRGDFEGVHQSYASAAADVGGLLLPAGEAWRAAWRREATLALYGSDGFHPTPLGSYLAALVIDAQLTNRRPADIARMPTRSVPSLTIAMPQSIVIGDAAAEAVSAARQP